MLIAVRVISAIWGVSAIYVAVVFTRETIAARRVKTAPLFFPSDWCNPNDRDPDLNPAKVVEARVARQEHDNR